MVYRRPGSSICPHVPLVVAKAHSAFPDNALPETDLTLDHVVSQLSIEHRLVKGPGRGSGPPFKVAVGLAGVSSSRRCGPLQETSPAPSAPSNPFWRNSLLVTLALVAMTSYDEESAR